LFAEALRKEACTLNVVTHAVDIDVRECTNACPLAAFKFVCMVFDGSSNVLKTLSLSLFCVVT
jgi:hypothetical protein